MMIRAIQCRGKEAKTLLHLPWYINTLKFDAISGILNTVKMICKAPTKVFAPPSVS